jgi:membrane associated rhomboid family serine protease
MLQPPSLKSVPRYPVTAGTGLAALTVTGLWWSGGSMDGFVMNAQVWEKWELWRALTSTLPHTGIFHLGFNLYWLWVFGTLLERVYGHLKFAGIVLLLAFGSMLAEFTLFAGGVGLSGVGYGLWGMLWALERHDARFAGSVDNQTSRLFVIWFFLCIALTITNVMPVANMAHGVGAGMGVLLGLAASGKGSLKWKSSAGLAAVLILVLAGSTVFWPRVNLSKSAQPEVEEAGLKALDRDDVPRAVKLLETSAHMRGAPARAWYNLGIAYQRLGNYERALAAFEHAAEMPGATSNYQKIVEETRAFLAPRKTE